MSCFFHLQAAPCTAPCRKGSAGAYGKRCVQGMPGHCSTPSSAQGWEVASVEAAGSQPAREPSGESCGTDQLLGTARTSSPSDQ